MLWLWMLCGLLSLGIAVLAVKLALLRRGLDEIAREFAEKLEEDTNTLVTVSGGDRHLRRLAAGINTRLRQLNRERRRFQRGETELTEAVTNISHDLRTPLTAICGYLDLLAREEKSEAVARYLAMIENRTEALKGQTEELFRYSVITSAAREAVYEEVALGDALEEALSAHYAALTGRGIEPDIHIPQGRVVRRLDRSALSRILGNIIGNAVKYSDGDLSVTLKENGEIIFSNRAKDLTPVTVGRLFDRFFTVETGRSATGLGLSIAKMLTEQMGGTIAAEYAGGRLSLVLRF